jgi:glutamyl-tRNA synthetase
VEAKAGALFLDDERLEYDPQAVEKFLARKDGAGYRRLEGILPRLEALDPWSAPSVERLLAETCEREGIKLGEIAQPLRVAVAGRAVSPAIHDTLALLGKERTLRRIRGCLLRRGGSS